MLTYREVCAEGFQVFFRIFLWVPESYHKVETTKNSCFRREKKGARGPRFLCARSNRNNVIGLLVLSPWGQIYCLENYQSRPDQTSRRISSMLLGHTRTS